MKMAWEPFATPACRAGDDGVRHDLRRHHAVVRRLRRLHGRARSRRPVSRLRRDSGPSRRYFIELGMGLCEQVYFDPALVDIIDGAFYYWNELKAKTLKLLPKWC